MGTDQEKKLDKELKDTFPASDAPSHTGLTSVGPPDPAVSMKRRDKRPAFGFALSSEETSPTALVTLAKMAEEAGFDFVSISDHFHPWIPEQGNSPFVWAVLGGIANATERITVGTGVTCPILRIHPVLVAQAAATLANMFEGRFYLGLGTGEALNELVVGGRWPSGAERLERLEEAIGIMRELFTGERVSHDGKFYTVNDARLYTLPTATLPILVAAASPGAATLAGKQDGLITTGPEERYMKAFEEAGGKDKPRVGQIAVCWDKDVERAKQTALKYWPNAALGWEASSVIPTPEVFEEATREVSAETVAQSVICGGDPGKVIEKIESYVKAGIDHVYIHQVGPQQAEFIEAYSNELMPRLRQMQMAA